MEQINGTVDVLLERLHDELGEAYPVGDESANLPNTPEQRSRDLWGEANRALNLLAEMIPRMYVPACKKTNPRRIRFVWAGCERQFLEYLPATIDSVQALRPGTPVADLARDMAQQHGTTTHQLAAVAIAQADTLSRQGKREVAIMAGQEIVEILRELAHPDGPSQDGSFWWQGVQHAVPGGKVHHLLRLAWNADSIPLDRVRDNIGRYGKNSLRSLIAKANKTLKEIGFPGQLCSDTPGERIVWRYATGTPDTYRKKSAG